MVRIIPLQVPKSCKDHSEQAMYVQYSSYSQFLQLIFEFDVFEGWGGVVLVHQLQEQTVTIPPLDPSARDGEEPDYDEEAQIWAAAMEHAAEVEDEETPDEYDWQISRLVSAATYTAGPDAGRVSTGRMKIT